MTIQKFIDIECAQRKLLESFGFKNKSDYYKERDRAYRDLEEDFIAETEDFEISVGQEEHIVRKLTEGNPTVTKPKLIFKRKQPNRRSK